MLASCLDKSSSLPVSFWRKSHCPYIARVKTLNAIARNYGFQNCTTVVPDFNLGGDGIEDIGFQFDRCLPSIVGDPFAQELLRDVFQQPHFKSANWRLGPTIHNSTVHHDRCRILRWIKVEWHIIHVKWNSTIRNLYVDL